MSDHDISNAVDMLTRRILDACSSIGGTKQVEIQPHSVPGHFVCRLQFEPRTNRNAYKKLFNGTAVGDSIYFIEQLPLAA